MAPRKTNVDGDPIAPFVKHWRKRRKTHTTDPYQIHKPRSLPRPNPNYYGRCRWSDFMKSTIWTVSQIRCSDLMKSTIWTVSPDSELDSESDEGEEYHYEHGYETLI